MCDRYFWDAGHAIDILVICYFGDQLVDSRPIEVGRLAHWFTTRGDWPILFEHSLTALGDRADFILSSAWLSYSVRARLRERILKPFVPEYRRFIQAMNDAELAQQQHSQPAAKPSGGRSYYFLRGLLARAQAEHVQVIFVAYPVRPREVRSGPRQYDLDEDALRLIRAANTDSIDLRRVDALTPDLYEDNIHLLPPGKAIFTPILAEPLSALVAAPH